MKSNYSQKNEFQSALKVLCNLCDKDNTDPVIFLQLLIQYCSYPVHFLALKEVIGYVDAD